MSTYQETHKQELAGEGAEQNGKALPAAEKGLKSLKLSNDSSLTKTQQLTPEQDLAAAKQFITGSGGEVNFEKAREHLERAIAANSADAICFKGKLCLEGSAYKRDDVQAVALFKQAASMGNAEGFYMHGYCMENVIGTGIEDHSRREMKPHMKVHALRSYVMAAQKGHPQALAKVNDPTFATPMAKQELRNISQKSADLLEAIQANSKKP